MSVVPQVPDGLASRTPVRKFCQEADQNPDILYIDLKPSYMELHVRWSQVCGEPV